MTALLELIKDHLVVKYTIDDKGELNIEESGHKQEGGKIRHIIKNYYKDNHPDLYRKVEEHTGMTFYKSLDRTKPFVVLMLAAGKISETEFIEGILKAPKDAKVVADYVEPAKFKDTLFDCYRMLSELQKEVKLASGGVEIVLPSLSGEKKITLDTILKSMGVPSYDTLITAVGGSGREKDAILKKLSALGADKDRIEKAAAEKEAEMTRIIQELGKASVSVKTNPIKIVADGKIPAGKVVTKTVKEIFGIESTLEVPFWEWDGPHPDVPAIDNRYIFREELLTRALYAIITNQRMYLQGHTGSGKTTLIEQIAARLNWPFMRINFDSEITRMDLIGRDTLKDGKSVFIDGMLPRAMSGPYITCFDEIDFCRPDVAYVMQAALEGNGLVITEDGGRVVYPNDMFRMFGTGNTVGQGDEHGMYQGARPQSLAFLDRFTIWGKVDYLDEQQRLNLIWDHYPTLSEKDVTTINKYTTEHLSAFKDAKILQPISPRGMLAIANATNFMNIMYPGAKDNLRKAVTLVVVDRATESDGAVIKGVMQRVLA